MSRYAPTHQIRQGFCIVCDETEEWILENNLSHEYVDDEETQSHG